MIDRFRGVTKTPPAPPSRAALAAVLAQVAEPDCRLLADQMPDENDWVTQRVDLASGWSLWVHWVPGLIMERLFAAQAPDGARWTFGCDRWPDWNAGPAAVVLDPLTHLITPEQRERLRQRLLTCNCWPEPDPLPLPPRRSPEEVERLLTFDVEDLAS
jgi:hypothetical protein